MAEHGLIFTGESVRAFLDGRKTMTRRVISPHNSLVDGHRLGKRGYMGDPDFWDHLDFDDAWVDRGPSPAGNPGPYLKAWYPLGESVHRIYPRIQAGDDMWVREAWQQTGEGWSDPPEVHELYVKYRADGEESRVYVDRKTWERYREFPEEERWHSPIFMPKWAARIRRQVVASRPERLQEISEEDAVAEGVYSVLVSGEMVSRRRWVAPGVRHTNVYGDTNYHAPAYDTARDAYAAGWDDLNASRGFPWNSNPLVWAHTLSSEDAHG